MTRMTKNLKQKIAEAIAKAEFKEKEEFIYKEHKKLFKEVLADVFPFNDEIIKINDNLAEQVEKHKKHYDSEKNGCFRGIYGIYNNDLDKIPVNLGLSGVYTQYYIKNTLIDEKGVIKLNAGGRPLLEDVKVFPKASPYNGYILNAELLEKVRALYLKEENLKDSKEKIKDSLISAFTPVTTVNKFIAQYPDFEKYIPTASNPKKHVVVYKSQDDIVDDIIKVKAKLDPKAKKGSR